MTDTTVIEQEAQPVVDTPAPPDPAPSHATDDFDQLLQEFSDGTAQPEPASDNPESDTQSDPLADVLRDPADQQRIDQLGQFSATMFCRTKAVDLAG